jgi:hypothetical protein
MLRGARLVTAQELAPGKAWDEPKLKSLTGGDPITARFMRQDFFTYEPQLRLVADERDSYKRADWEPPGDTVEMPGGSRRKPACQRPHVYEQDGAAPTPTSTVARTPMMYTARDLSQSRTQGTAIPAGE